MSDDASLDQIEQRLQHALLRTETQREHLEELRRRVQDELTLLQSVRAEIGSAVALVRKRAATEQARAKLHEPGV